MDLDNLYRGIPARSESLLPKTTCTIIKRIVDNALALELDELVIDVGYGKCDAARAAASILTNLLGVPMTLTRNANVTARPTPISDSRLPLLEKIELILDDIITPRERDLEPEAHPPAAIWGVPAADFEIYRLFPDGTRVLGWTRCLEAGVPADEELELYVEPGLPTVFFAQTFCHKNILAQHLAAKYDGLYVDVDGALTRSARAKTEAFLHFRGAI